MRDLVIRRCRPEDYEAVHRDGEYVDAHVMAVYGSGLATGCNSETREQSTKGETQERSARVRGRCANIYGLRTGWGK